MIKEHSQNLKGKKMNKKTERIQTNKCILKIYRKYENVVNKGSDWNGLP